MAWGWRGGGRAGWGGPWPGRGPFSYLPPWQRPGWILGMGAVYGGWPWGYPISPWACARFPWLPRWWWARPGYGIPFYWGAYAPYPWSIYPFPPVPYWGYW